MSIKESPVPIKTEPEEETCADVFEYDVALIKTERALMYAGHEVKKEMVIGPTEILRPPPGVGYPYWEVARRAVAHAGVANEVEFLRRLYSSRLVLQDAAHELLCARCGQWSLTAAELHQHRRAAHSTEHPRDCLQTNSCTMLLGNGFQTQFGAFIDQRDNTSRPTTPSHQLDTTFELKDNVIQPKMVSKLINSLSCDICSKSCSSKGNLKRHKLIHSGKRPFSCDTCGKSFIQKHHLSIHKGSKLFACDICGKSFTQKATLSGHMRTHDGSKPFACNECGKNFRYKSDLSKHMLIHNDTRSFACDTCNKSFKHKATLRNHVLIHIGIKKFECDKCGKRFARTSYFSNHLLRIHDETKAFTCDNCGRKFAKKSDFTRHMHIHSRC